MSYRKDEILEMFMEKQLLSHDETCITCLCCKLTDKSVLSSVFIPGSPIGSGGEYDLCVDCALGALDDAEQSLQDYYSSIM